jgi:hypothetical protein
MEISRKVVGARVRKYSLYYFPEYELLQYTEVAELPI